MQVDPKSLSVYSKITASNVIRSIVSCVLVNFAHDTTNFTDGTWSDETNNVIDISCDGGLPPPQEGAGGVGQTQSQQMSISFRNSAGRFSPNLTTGANYTNIRMDGGGNNKGIYQTPIQWWQGQYHAGGQFACSNTLALTTTTTTFTLVLQEFVPAVGQIIQFNGKTEYMLIIKYDGTTVTVLRGLDSTAQAVDAETSFKIYGSMARIFTGIIHRPTETSRGYSTSYECLDRSYMLMQNKAVTAVSQGVSPDTFITTILSQLPSSPTYAPVPAAQRSLDSGLFPLNFALMDDESCWEEASKIANADGGYLFFSARGKLRYWNPQHLLLAEADTDSISTSHTASQYTFDVSNMADMSLGYDYDNIFSNVVVQFSPRSIAPLQAIYSSNEVVEIPPSSTRSIIARYNYPAVSVATPVGGAAPASGANDTRDFAAVTAGGVDITSSVTVSTFTAYGLRANLTYTNANTSYTAFVVRQQIRGKPLMGGPIKEARSPNTGENTTTPADIPSRSKVIGENWFIQNEYQAKALAQFLADRFKTARASMRLAGVAGCPLLEYGDRCTISNANILSSNLTAYVMKIASRVEGIESGRQRFVQDIEPIDQSALFQQSNGANYFVVGTSALSNSKVYWY